MMVDANLGQIKLQGLLSQLQIKSANANIDATNLNVNTIDIEINGNGSLKLNTAEKLSGSINKNAQIIFKKQPNELTVSSNDGKVLSIKDFNEPIDPNAKWIDFKIRNNSRNRHHFYVLEAKPDGRQFSYGFAMMPFTNRKERWTVGTKIYKVNPIGTKQWLLTISISDENQVVNLFKP